MPRQTSRPAGVAGRIASLAMLALCQLALATANADERPLKVAVIGNSPPMSYENSDGKLIGFNVELAAALCETMKVRCELQRVSIGDVVDVVASGEADFAAVSLLVTPERQQKVLFSKPYYRSLSIWLARPGIKAGDAGIAVAVVRGSAQARYVETHGWKSHIVEHHRELPPLLANGTVSATIVPMPTALQLAQQKELLDAGIRPTILPDPALGGDVAFSICPQRPELRARLDAAIDKVKSDGRFDRINTRYLPFRLQ